MQRLKLLMVAAVLPSLTHDAGLVGSRPATFWQTHRDPSAQGLERGREWVEWDRIEQKGGRMGKMGMKG